MSRIAITIGGSEAAAYVAHKTNEVVALYPILPASAMGELADARIAREEKNIWGNVPTVVEMQSEGGATGGVHGALQAGSLTTTFTASQGLLLMIPNMYKLAGERTSTVFHVAARSMAPSTRSICGDHSDVMAARATGWGMLFAGSVQEAMDFALIAQAATLKSRVPFLHVFDGLCSSHDLQEIEQLSDADLRAMIDDGLVRAHHTRALSPGHPVIRRTAQDPDVSFQTREAANPYYPAVPRIVQQAMDQLGGLVGRKYRLFDYVGAPDAERVVVLMGSGCETAGAAVACLAGRGEKVGAVKIRLYRPFSAEHFLGVLPPTVKAIAVLDRTKEPGAAGEPLYQDVVTAINEGMWNGQAAFAAFPRIIGGRYGLSSKAFTPAMAKAVFDELAKPQPKNHFTVGSADDVTRTSLAVDPGFDAEPALGVTRAECRGPGSDGTGRADEDSVKTIAEDPGCCTEGAFVLDSKSPGSRPISHLRFGPGGKPPPGTRRRAC